MEHIWKYICEHASFFTGLLLGLLITFFVWKNALTKRLHLSKENKRLDGERSDLQTHLQTHLKIHSGGNEKLQQELESLRTQNETLRLNMSTLQHKPGSAELRQLRINEGAIRMMREQAPGFAPAWEKALRQAEADMESAESGLKKLVRRVQTTMGLTPNSPPAQLVPEDKSEPI